MPLLSSLTEVNEAALQGDVLVEAAVFGHIADALFRVLGHGAAEDGDGAAVGFKDVEEHTDSGGLAGAVGTQEAEDLAGADLEGDIFDGLGFAEAFGDV
jgi:hypothetical protein